MRNNVTIISKKVLNITSMKKLTYYLGKKVFSKSGEYSGKIIDVFLNKGNLSGILIRGKEKYFLDKEFFTSDTGDAVLISIDPVVNAIGKEVFDSEGRKLGKVIGMDRKNTDNDYTFMIVKKHALSAPFSVPKAHVEVCKKNVILNKEYGKK